MPNNDVKPVVIMSQKAPKSTNINVSIRYIKSQRDFECKWDWYYRISGKLAWNNWSIWKVGRETNFYQKTKGVKSVLWRCLTTFTNFYKANFNPANFSNSTFPSQLSRNTVLMYVLVGVFFLPIAYGLKQFEVSNK